MKEFLDAQSLKPLPLGSLERPDRNEYRLAFFFHYLDLAKPLEFELWAATAAGPITAARAFGVHGLGAAITLLCDAGNTPGPSGSGQTRKNATPSDWSAFLPTPNVGQLNPIGLRCARCKQN